jgi:general secretion pathway protein G
MNKKETGFTLIELLIVVAIIGIIAAIAIPNLLNAIDRSKQKRTMADMRSIGTACEEYAIDNNFYPNTAGTRAALTSTSVVTLALQNGYIKIVPIADGWNWPIEYGTPTGGTGYTIVSPGKDGPPAAALQQIQTNNFNCEIAFMQGQFIEYPQGIQT